MTDSKLSTITTSPVSSAEPLSQEPIEPSRHWPSS
eukprot:CAMPEP_0170638428 /NCGR_PEP_ID=MMETSP0224-20130122/39026_1 /TAXON_ID=285029 /ORGANISM="Togula jolla, Strain CCCM 725" /LENGTH=34 /DNA_ID= /DNA_START= /DNA_END= /DNA_ORIENTATION=